MFNATYKVQKQTVDNFFQILTKKLSPYYFDLSTLGHISKRKIFHLLKMSMKADGREFNKKDLKKLAKFLSEVDLNNESKKYYKWAYKEIMFNDIFELIKDFFRGIYIFVLIKNIQNNIYKKVSHYVVHNIMQRSGILRI